VLSPDERRLYEVGFKALRPREFVSLLLAGEWRDAKPGERIVEHGRAIERIAIPIAGAVEVSRHGQRLGEMKPGEVVGLGLAVSGEAPSFDATFTEAGRYMSWPLPSLRMFLDKRPDLRVALQRLASHDLATKLERLMPRDA
jgi:CRP-like cAMP-binding protein